MPVFSGQSRSARTESTIEKRREEVVKSTRNDTRFTEPLYTVAEAARFVGVPSSTLGTWAQGYVRRPTGRREVRGQPIVKSIAADRGYPTVPFVGLAEAMVLTSFRLSGVSLQHLRRAVAVLECEMGMEHALASSRLYSDGAVVLFDYADRQGDAEFAGLTDVVSRQRVFSSVIEDYLERIEYDDDPWAVRVASPVTRRPVVVADPERAFGQPIFRHGAAPVESVRGRVDAGEPIEDVARDFGVPVDDVAEFLRVPLPVAA